MSKPLLIAHRGDTTNFPENTLESFQSAFDKSADGIELDIQFNRGELIVVHNYLYDQTKNYITLKQVLELFVDKGRIEIEIKSFDVDLLLPLKDLLGNYKEADIEITTCVLPLTSYLHKELSSFPLGIIFNPMEFETWMTSKFIRTKVVKMMQLCKAQRAHIPYKLIDEAMVTECHSHDLLVHGHIHKTAIEEQVHLYQHFQKLGVDQCTIDDIALLNEVI